MRLNEPTILKKEVNARLVEDVLIEEIEARHELELELEKVGIDVLDTCKRRAHVLLSKPVMKQK